MNLFEKKLNEKGYFPLTVNEINTLQVNLSYKCNLRCSHCHVEASPERTEEMSLSTVENVLSVLKRTNAITTVILTGGAPELNSHFKFTVKASADMRKQVIVCSNLTIYKEPGMEGIPEFLADNKIKIITSLPSYIEETVDKQRGKGTYRKIISELKHLNSLGYGQEDKDLKIDIIFNPENVALAPDQQELEKIYKNKLKEMHDITFNHLITFSNMPLGRLRKSMTATQAEEFIELIEKKFNPDTVEDLMCRYQINISPNGRLYNCGFMQSLNVPIDGTCSTINDFDYDLLSNRQIVTNELCLLCTATEGTTCRCCIK